MVVAPYCASNLPSNKTVLVMCCVFCAILPPTSFDLVWQELCSTTSDVIISQLRRMLTRLGSARGGPPVIAMAWKPLERRQTMWWTLLIVQIVIFFINVLFHQVQNTIYTIPVYINMEACDLKIENKQNCTLSSCL